LSGSGATVEVVLRLGFSVGGDEMRAPLFIYAGDSRGGATRVASPLVRWQRWARAAQQARHRY
jgi:hypothetical protein